MKTVYIHNNECHGISNYQQFTSLFNSFLMPKMNKHEIPASGSAMWKMLPCHNISIAYRLDLSPSAYVLNAPSSAALAYTFDEALVCGHWSNASQTLPWESLWARGEWVSVRRRLTRIVLDLTHYGLVTSSGIIEHPSPFVQVMTCCLMSAKYCLNQWWYSVNWILENIFH